MLGKRTRPFWKNSSKFRPMDFTSKASTIKVPFVHVNADQDGARSPKSPLEIKSSCLKSPRGWQKKDSEGIGLGILAAMSNGNVGNDAVIASKASITAIQAVPVKNFRASAPIPIVSANASSRFRDTRAESELSESYTCVIARCDPNSVRKHEYFHETEEEKPIEFQWSFDSSAFFCSSPPRFQGAIFHSNDFLNCCYLCAKNLQGKDVYMYRGDKAFCSVECRYQQIVNDEYREKHGFTEAMVKPMDCSAASPCSAPRLFYAGVAVA